MNNLEKYEVVGAYLAQHPDHSDRQIAVAVGVSPTFAGKVRRYLQAKGRLAQVEKRVGQDGRRRGRRRSAEEIERIRRAEEAKIRKQKVAEITDKNRRRRQKQLAKIEMEMSFYRNSKEPLAQKWLAELEEQRTQILEEIAFFEQEKWRE